MVILVPEKLLMSKLLLMAATLVASNAVMATTVIDVNVMVPKSIVDQDGAEKVFNTIHQRVAAMDEYYTSQRTGIVKNGNPENLHFEVKQILVMSDTVLNPTCKTGYSAALFCSTKRLSVFVALMARTSASWRLRCGTVYAPTSRTFKT